MFTLKKRPRNARAPRSTYLNVLGLFAELFVSPGQNFVEDLHSFAEFFFGDDQWRANLDNVVTAIGVEAEFFALSDDSSLVRVAKTVFVDWFLGFFVLYEIDSGEQTNVTNVTNASVFSFISSRISPRTLPCFLTFSRTFVIFEVIHGSITSCASEWMTLVGQAAAENVFVEVACNLFVHDDTTELYIAGVNALRK